jgi:O-antigen/teichoic acid export membrane protein
VDNELQEKPTTINQTGLLFGSTSIFISTVVIYAARFITSAIVARSLGIEGKGAYALVLTTASLLLLAVNLGLNASITYFAASKKFTSRSLFGFSILSTVVLSAFGSLLFLVIYKLILSNTLLRGLTTGQLWFVIIALPVILLQSMMLNILLGMQKIIIFTSVNISFALLSLVFQIISYILKLGLPGALGSWALANLIETMLLIGLLLWTAGIAFHNVKPIVRTSLAYGIKSYVANLTSFFNYRLDTFLVNYYLGRGDLGLYTTGVSVAEFLWYLPNAISSALFPKVSSLEKTTAHKLTAQATRITLAVIIPAAIVFGVMGAFLIPIIFGESFRPSINPYLWLLPGVISMAVSKVLTANLSGIGKPEYATYTATAGMIATVALDVLLIPRFNIIGAALASSIAYNLIAVILVFWFLRESHMKWSQVIIPTKADWHLVREKVSVAITRISSRLPTSTWRS